MDIDEQIALAEERLEKLRDLKAQLEAIVGGVVVERKARVCSKCGRVGHQARTCTHAANSETQTVVVT